MAWNPTDEIQIVAGTPPGGGLDRSARALASAMAATGAIKVPVAVVNIGGEGGRRAWAHIERQAGNAHVVGIGAPNIRADFLMGASTLDPDRFVPLAMLYSEYIAFLARADTAYRTGQDLVDALVRDAGAVTVALSTSLGNSNHVAVAKVVRHAGADSRAPKIRVFDSAVEAVADVVAGHAQVGAVTAASAVKEVETGRLVCIGMSAPQRLAHPYAGSPTWVEQGVDCVVDSWRGLIGPPGLDRDQVSYWQGVVAAAINTEAWRGELARHLWSGLHLDGPELRDYLKREADEMRAILGELGLLPK